MQPFDGGTFDNRYTEVFMPAIRAAGLEPYRVDQDPSASIPIQEIENGIRNARVCLAEITEDNPNVWFELGYAIACRKEVVLVCADARKTKFPFDVQHRTIIKYATGIPSDFERLKTNVTAKLQAYLEKTEALETVADMTPLASAQAGLTPHEAVALAAVAQNGQHEGDHVSAWRIKADMETSGYTAVAASLALRSLSQNRYLTWEMFDGEEEQYAGYMLTPHGWDWMMANQDKLVLHKLRPVPVAIRKGAPLAARDASTP